MLSGPPFCPPGHQLGLCPQVNVVSSKTVSQIQDWKRGTWLKVALLRLITFLCVFQHLSLLLRSYLSITSPSTFLSAANMHTRMHTWQNMSPRKQVKIKCCISHDSSYVNLSLNSSYLSCLKRKKQTFDLSKITSAECDLQHQQLCQTMKT